MVSTAISGLSAFLRFVQLLPGAVIVAIIALALTLLGILLIDSGHTKRLTAWMAHESKQRDRERETALRRDVYLAVADYLANLRNSLLNLPAMDLRDNGFIARVKGAESVYYKVHMVGSNETIEKLEEVTIAFADMARSLMPYKTKLSLFERESARLDAEMETLATEKSDLLVALKSLDQTGRLGAGKLDALIGRFEELKARSRDAQNQRAELGHKIYRLKESLSLECAAAAIKLDELIIPVNRSIRAEFRIPIDSDRYEDMTRESQNRAREAYEKLFIETRKLLNEQSDADP